ncbi:hypothetical protein OROGR_012165 [Orobanche gracilis]
MVDVYLFDRSVCEGEILGYDFHHNVVAIRIKSAVQLQAAVIRNLDDCMECHARFDDTSFHLARHRETPTSQGLIKLCPGMAVIALGRYYDDRYHIMAAPGKLIMEDSGLDCRELGMASSEITKFTSVLLDKAKEPTEVIVKRSGSIAPLTLTVLPQSTKKLNRWPLPEECSVDLPCHEIC